MIDGTVSIDGTPEIVVRIGERDWTAVIDTGFNGDLELPKSLQKEVDATYVGQMRSTLAAGQTIEEPCYSVRFPFDGELYDAQATFVDEQTILIGTRLLDLHRLTIDFPKKSVRIEPSQTDT